MLDMKIFVLQDKTFAGFVSVSVYSYSRHQSRPVQFGIPSHLSVI